MPAQGLEIISNIGCADTFGHVKADYYSCSHNFKCGKMAEAPE